MTLASCPATKFIGLAPATMTEMDKYNFKTALKRCPELYPNSPCVKVFEQKGFQNYLVTCGR